MAHEAGSFVFSCRGEGDGLTDRPVGTHTEMFIHRFLRRVRVGEGSVHMTDDLVDLGVRCCVKSDDLLDLKISGRDGACLVCTDNICAGEGFDRCHLLDQGLLSRKPADTDDEGDGCEEDQTLGDHADDAGDCADDCGVEISACRLELASEEQEPDRYDYDRDHFDDPADRSLHFGAGALLVRSFADQLGGIAFISDLLDLHACGPGCDKASGEDLIAVFFADRLRFSRQHGLVDFQTLAVIYGSVCDDLVSGSHKDHVIPYDLVDRNFSALSVPQRVHLCRCDDGQLVDQGLDFQLLDNTDQRIADTGAEEENVLDLACDQDENSERDIQKVEVCQRVARDDAADGFLSLRDSHVDLALLYPVLDFLGSETCTSDECDLPVRGLRNECDLSFDRFVRFCGKLLFA